MSVLLARLHGITPSIQARAQRLDREAAFPVEDVALLRQAGALEAVLPTAFGGIGIGTEPASAAATASVLHAIGYASLPLGRIYEAHVNAIRLIMRLACSAQRAQAAERARMGDLFALWVTDGQEKLRFYRAGGRISLTGGKHFCSAAGFASQAVVTAADESGDSFLLLLPLQHGETTAPLETGLQGMRAAATGKVDFTGTEYPEDAVFGPAGGYGQEPDFTVGAWRASAIASGGLAAIVEAARAELATRGRLAHPNQRERFGRMLINAQTARLWTDHTAPVSEAPDANPGLAAATVNLARIAIETACLDTIALVQRSLGLSAFMPSNPVERLGRDLATYLRQPAADEALDEAAAYFAAAD